MDLKKITHDLSNIYDACQRYRPENIDLADILTWRQVSMDLHLLKTKKGDEYNFMKTISHSHELFVEAIPVIKETFEDLDTIGKRNFMGEIERNYEVMKSRLEQHRFNISFYEQFGYFNNNVVAVGANGSGKTSLADNLRSSLNNNGLVISAQRVLFIPEIESIPNPELSEQRWNEMNKRSRTFKDIDDFLEIKEEFGYVLGNLIAKHCAYAIKQLENPDGKRMPSELEDTLRIWNEVFEHRKLKLIEGIRLKVIANEESYDPLKLSEGEKSALYLISQVIQAPTKGFIIIDEPEMYLHKTIISRIWDLLERHRQDCTFIYLTHDLDFATSRNTASKVWLRSFQYPNKWDISRIPENEIPEKLMLELLGSRKNILFCEGEKGSTDQSIYQTLLPNFTVMPVNGCLNVINFTKAYNRIPNVNNRAYGIIDSDYHTEIRLDKLRGDKVYSLKLAEVENLFLYDKLLEIMASIFLAQHKIETIKDEILRELEKDKQLQALRYVSNKINNVFNESHMQKANSLEQLEVNYGEFNNQIKIAPWFQSRLRFIEDIISRKDYHAAIAIFNHKGLKEIVKRNFSKPDYIDYVLKYLPTNESAMQVVKHMLPKELLNL